MSKIYIALKKVFRTAVVIYILFGLILILFQEKYIYFPENQDFNNCPSLVNAEKVNFNETRMYVQKTTDTWVVMYHGNAGSACGMSYMLNYFSPKDYSYIIVEYTGYSNDNKKPTEKALVQNAIDVNDYIKTQNSKEVIVIGQSLGAALASYQYSLGGASKLLLISPFNNFIDVSKYHYWYYPVKFMLRATYHSDDWIKDSNNVFIIHGSKDTIIPIKFGKILYDEIKGPNKTFIEIQNAGHNDLFDFIDTEKAIDSFKSSFEVRN